MCALFCTMTTCGWYELPATFTDGFLLWIGAC
jgi:hypothetical protein